MESQVIYFQFMHCFEGHHVTTLGEITSNSGGHHVQVMGVRPSNILKIRAANDPSVFTITEKAPTRACLLLSHF